MIITRRAFTAALSLTGLGLLAGFSWFDNPSFMGAHGQQTAKWLQIDFMRKRYLWFAISGAIVAIGIGALSTKGLNLGIDFKGGTQFSFNTPAPTSLATVRTDVANAGYSDAVVQGRGKLTGSDEYKQFQTRTKPLTPKQQGAL